MNSSSRPSACAAACARATGPTGTGSQRALPQQTESFAGPNLIERISFAVRLAVSIRYASARGERSLRVPLSYRVTCPLGSRRMAATMRCSL